jgi:hypothetical protein
MSSRTQDIRGLHQECCRCLNMIMGASPQVFMYSTLSTWVGLRDFQGPWMFRVDRVAIRG